MKHLKVGVSVLLLVTVCVCEQNLYDVLGVKRSATQKEIRGAYKRAARESHPDKSNDPDATDKFTKINEAYETLGDAEKRREYDDFGYTSANARQPQQRPQGFHQGFDPFESFFSGGGGGGFKFNFGGSGGGESIIDKHRITLREYETTIAPNSHKKPCIIYLYTDFCFNCMRVESTVEKFIQELRSIGLCAATVHAGRSGNLVSQLRVTSVPYIVGVVGERLAYFRGGVNFHSLKEFAHHLFPANFITPLTELTLQPFLDGWMDNHVRAIFFCPKEDKPLRFVAAAYYYRDYVQFSFVYTKSRESAEIVRRFSVNKNRETLLMFNEETKSPVATLSMLSLSRTSLDEVIEGNKHLMLPRLSSQQYFDDLCPEEYKVKNRKLCVVLITKKSPDHNLYREGFRRFSQSSQLAWNPRVQFTYLYEETQEHFVKSLSKGKLLQANSAQLMVAILWRQEKNQMKYEWLEGGWTLDHAEDDEEFGGDRTECAQTLDDRLTVLLTTDSVMPYRVSPPTLYNEHGLALPVRIWYKLCHWGDKAWSYLSVLDSTTWITLMLSLMFVGGMAYFMQRLASLEEIQVQTNLPQQTRPRPPSRTFDEKNLKLYELDYRTYNDLVSQADTGLTIAVLVDKDSKDKLVKKFAEIVHPYSRYSALTFAFLALEYNIGWYRTLLEESIDGVKLETINARNCIGTILAINGYRHYYYLYSAKRTRQFIRRRNNVTSALVFGLLGVAWLLIMLYIWFPDLISQRSALKDRNLVQAGIGAEAGGAERAQYQMARYNSSGLKDLVHVCITSDSNTVGGMVTLVNSIDKNSKHPVMFHLVVDRETEEHLRTWIAKTRLHDVLFEVKIFPEEWVSGKIKVRSGRRELAKPMNYARYYLPRLFPKLNRIVFIDDDSLVLGDIFELYSMQIKPKHWAAFANDGSGSSKRVSMLRNLYADFIEFKNKHVQFMDMSPTTSSFNTGVYVTDLDLWRKNNITQKLEYWLELNTKEEVYGNEKGGGGSAPPMMIVFYEKYTEIDPMWHIRNLGVTRGTSFKASFLQHSKLLHWNGIFKPWGRNSQHAKIWDQYFIPDPMEKFIPIRRS